MQLHQLEFSILNSCVSLHRQVMHLSKMLYRPAGLVSVQMCHRELRAGGSRPVERHCRRHSNSHLCNVCHALVVQVLTFWTRLCFSVCHKHTLTYSDTVTLLAWPRGHYICLTWLSVSCFLTQCPWELVLLTDMSDGPATCHASSRTTFGCT